MARFTPAKVEKLLADPGIIRNRLKVNAAVGNARAFLAVQNEFGSFDAFIWGFVGWVADRQRLQTLADIPALTPESEALSRELVRRGFRFVGPTIVYAHMQACGLVNDHLVDCPRWAELGGRTPRRAGRARAGRTA